MVQTLEELVKLEPLEMEAIMQGITQKDDPER